MSLDFPCPHCGKTIVLLDSQVEAMGLKIDWTTPVEWTPEVIAEFERVMRQRPLVLADQIINAIGQETCTCSRTEAATWTTGFTWEYQPCPVHGSPTLRQ